MPRTNVALILPGSRCPICQQALSPSDLYLATSGCAFTPEHRLFPFCDAPLHLSCVEAWADREEFARGYHDLELASWRSGYGTLLHMSDEWFVGTGPSVRPSFPHFVQVRIRDWPLRLYTRFEQWDAFVSDGYAARLGGMSLVRAKSVMLEVRHLFPNQGSLVAMWQSTTPSSPPKDVIERVGKLKRRPTQ